MKFTNKLYSIPILLLGVFNSVKAAESKFEPEFEAVTCSSTIKLQHVSTGYRLHSHGVAYGTGSEQQSVTCYPDADDTNSLWTIHGAFGTYCKRGEPIKCGSVIRIKHLNTGKWLHSHHYRSPLSNQQEISAFDGEDSGDNWIVQCVDPKDKYWIREKNVRFLHKDTNVYMTSSQHFAFRNPIPGQLEIAGNERTGEQSKWKTSEGIYFSDITKSNQ